MKFSKIAVVILIASNALSGCGEANNNNNETSTTTLLPEYQNRLDIYKTVKLTADLSH
jgi:hypothetical protein